jgi:hypothetical protein
MSASNRHRPKRHNVERDGADPDRVAPKSGERESSTQEATTPTPEGYGTPEQEEQVDAERAANEREPTDEELEVVDDQLDARGDLAIDTAPRTFSRPHGQNSDVVDADSDEPQGDVDLVGSSVREASLFDQPSIEGDPHPPRVNADEMRALDEHEGTSATSPSEREAEKSRSREKLRKARASDEPGATRRGKKSA